MYVFVMVCKAFKASGRVLGFRGMRSRSHGAREYIFYVESSENKDGERKW